MCGVRLPVSQRSRPVAVGKKFFLGKPQTFYRITETGRAALAEYFQTLKQLLARTMNV